MITAIYLIPVLFVLVIMLIKVELANKRRQIYLLKPISTLLVINIGLFAFLQPIYNTGFLQLVLLGLLFSLGGDLALMFPQNRKAFTIGLGLFLMAHIIYTFAFTLLGSLSIWVLLPLFLLLILGGGFYMLIHAKLGSMKGPVIAYILIISVMVGSATTVIGSPDSNPVQWIMILIGAVLFYISDLILAANRFWKPWKYNRISLAFYYSGQLLIALSASYAS